MKLANTLSKKVLYTFAFLSIATVASLAAIQVFTVYPAFVALEEQQADRDVERLYFSLEKEMQRLATINLEYSDWEASYDFMIASAHTVGQSGTAHYIEEDLDPEYFADIGVDAVFMLNLQGEVVWQSLHHPSLGELDIAQQVLTPLHEKHPLLAGEAGASAQGVLNTHTDPLILVSEPIVGGVSPNAAGTLILGRYLDEGFLAELGKQISIDVAFSPIENDNPSGQAAPMTPWIELSGSIERPAMALAIESDAPGISWRDLILGDRAEGAGYSDDARDVSQPARQTGTSRKIQRLIRFQNVFGQPGVVLEVNTPRRISALGLDAMRLTTLSMVTATLLIGLVFLTLMRRMIVTPVGRVIDHMLKMRDSGDLTMRLDIRSNDEIGALSEEFDKLAARLYATQLDLETTRDEAIALAHAKSDFLATMSHEIRTPMNGVLGMAQLLDMTRLDNEQRSLLTNIQNSGDLLLNIINDILDFSKLEAGKLELAYRSFNLRALVEDLVTMMSVQAHTRDLELLLSYPVDGHEMFRGDAQRIRQILVNLVGNAIKFTEEGEVLVKVDVAAQAGAADSTVVIEVVDTGIGISPEQQDAIFDAFSQADSSSARRFQGTGLGLSITSRLLRLMDGSVTLQSEQGKGSRFIVHLPLAATSAAEPDSTRPRYDDSRGYKVLLAEDNVINQKVALHILTSMGCDVELANDGYEVVSMADGSHDLVLMDLKMPGLDGIDATRQIREQEAEGRRMPIVAFTADLTSEEQSRCAQAGMDDFIRKPVGSEQLSDVLQRWCGDNSLETMRQRRA